MADFTCLTVSWFKRAHVYVGSAGSLFRYRFAMDGKEKTITASVYTRVCFEVATDVETEVFSWDEDGVVRLRDWLTAAFDRKTADAQ